MIVELINWIIMIKYILLGIWGLLLLNSCENDDFVWGKEDFARIVGPEIWTRNTDSMTFTFSVYPEEVKEFAVASCVVIQGKVAVVFLYIGMIGMDKSNKKKFHNIYGKMVGIKFTYEIDAENIIITDEENDSDTFSWNEVVKWNQDPDNIYLFVGDDNCLVVSKKGFTQGSADDLRQLADAVIGMRNVTGNSQQ